MAIGRPDFDKNKTNIFDDTSYSQTTIFDNGFQAGSTISSEQVNSLMREFSLLSESVESYVNLTDISINSDKSDWVSQFATKMNAKILSQAEGSYTFTKSTSNNIDTLSIKIGSKTLSQSVNNSEKATKLSTPRSIQVDLASAQGSNFDGSSNVTPGVTGILTVANGGTGKSSLSDVKVGSAGKADLATKADDSDKLGGNDPSYYAKAEDVAATSGQVDGATPNNVAEKIVKRDTLGGFKAGTIEATFKGTLTGNASSADKINTNVAIGSATKPVYINNTGAITPITYSIEKNVPSDAVFTDHYAWSDITGKPNTFAVDKATTSVFGGIKTGYVENGKNYKVQLDTSGNAYVNVPWTDNNTIYTAGTGLTLSNTTFNLSVASSSSLGGVKLGYSSSSSQTTFPVLIETSTGSNKDKLYVNIPNATGSAGGLMSYNDKNKLDSTDQLKVSYSDGILTITKG